jgi:WD40 repeat protein
MEEEDYIFEFELSPDGQYVLLFDEDGLFRILHWQSNQFVKNMNLTDGIDGWFEVSPDGKLIRIQISGAHNRACILVWDIFNNKYLGAIPGDAKALFGPQNTLITLSEKQVVIYQKR